MKRIVTFEHFPAVGPSSSVGNVYLGPFFYYFMAPWLALFGFSPLGPAVGVALISALFIVITYYAVRDLFDSRTGIIASTLVAFSAVLVDLSRFSWNPNILPVFSFIALYLFIKALLTGKRFFYILTGAFLGFAFQLHYVMFSVLLACVVVYTLHMFKHKKGLRAYLQNGLIILSVFILTNTPLILFDIRHNFLNAKNFITLFQKPGSAASTSLTAIIDGFQSLNTFALSVPPMPFAVALLLLGIFIFSLRFWKDELYQYLGVFFLVALCGTSFMTANKFPHYFGALYPLYYLLLAIIMSRFIENKKNAVLIAFSLLILFIGIQIKHYSFLYTDPHPQIAHAQRTAQKMMPLIKSDSFRVTAIPEYTGTSMYSYFLELWGNTPVDNQSLAPAEELFVICEKECAPIGNPQWDIAYYQPTSIQDSFTSDHIFIYKLIK